MSFLEEISTSVRYGIGANIKALIENALEDNISPGEILNNGLIPGMIEISRLFKNNEVYIPEVLVAASAMHSGIEVLEPLLLKKDNHPIATIVLGTVKGDLHNIGKRLVAIMLEGNGFKVIDLGVDIPPYEFAEQAKEHSADIVAISALLTTTMPMMKTTVEAIKSANLKKKVKTIIGGAPVTLKFAKLINADGYAADAASAVDIVKKLLKIS